VEEETKVVIQSEPRVALLLAILIPVACASPAPPGVRVASARKELQAGAQVDADSFVALAVPVTLATKGVLRWSELKAQRDRKLGTKLRKGGILLRTMLTPPPPTFRPSSRIPQGLRAVTLPVRGLAATRPGDVVDFWVTARGPARDRCGRPKMAPAPVTKKGAAGAKSASAPVAKKALSEKLTVTGAQRVEVIAAGDADRGVSVAVLPQEALLLLLASQRGQLDAALRRPDDLSLFEERQPANHDTLMSGERVAGGCSHRRPNRTIQIIRGITKKVKR
jgi:pilus assembly protein CpaB